MNWQKANEALLTIGRLLKLFETTEGLLDIERDLLLRRIQDLYQIVLEDKLTEQPKPAVVTVTKPETPKPTPPKVEKPKVVTTPKPAVIVPPVVKKTTPPPTPKPVVATPKPTPPKVEKPVAPKVEKPKFELPKFELRKPRLPKFELPKPKVEKPKPMPPKVVKVVKPKVEKPTPKPPKPVQPKTPVVQKPIITTSGNEEIDALFEFKTAMDLSERLSASPIKNLKTAMSINERFVTISVLFKGNNDEYNGAIDKLNGMSNFDQAKAYIINTLIPAFDWTNNKKQDSAKAFIKKVRRRYL